ncbi:hypothetical protein [Amantichitinum ursilacus]|uniref:hypothetical protein n=1 Tax=Amantichitinum ursilacus TaxID=857265 RepID=UPI00128F68F3|nr:hypothetical protein [Amantichitinum ursilacus]
MNWAVIAVFLRVPARRRKGVNDTANAVLRYCAASPRHGRRVAAAFGGTALRAAAGSWLNSFCNPILRAGKPIGSRNARFMDLLRWKRGLKRNHKYKKGISCNETPFVLLSFKNKKKRYRIK